MNADEAVVALRPRDVADLTVVSGFPCISVVLPTRPAARMQPEDLAHLRSLVSRVEVTLGDVAVTRRGQLVQKLTNAADAAAARPTGRGLAIYVNQAVSRTFTLPQAVTPLAVVERTFATRALVAALHRMPPHAVLALHPTCAHLYASVDGDLRPRGEVGPFTGGRAVRVPRQGDRGAAGARERATEDFLAAVDRMLGDYRADHPSPLVLAGPPRLVERFRSVSRHLGRLAGPVDTRDLVSPLDLAAASTEAVDAYLRGRRRDALDLLRRTAATRPSDVVEGVADCERALRSWRPSMLLVEDDFVSPGSAAADSQAHRSPVHDVVDDLMEQTIMLGGQLALMQPGDLAEHGRIALIRGR